MGIRLYNNFCYQIEDSSKRKKKKVEFQTEEKEVQKKDYKTKNIDMSSSEILANYARANIKTNRHKYIEFKDGHARYDYKGARFDIYKKDDEYKSQFVYPKDFNVDEFVEKFPQLESQSIIKTDSTTINGEIDETVSQSSITGDCWLISSIVSMSKDEKGKEIIKNSINVNDDNSVTVSFKGIGVSYTLSQEEIAKYDTDNTTYDKYSNGDNDMLVLELAAEKLWKDIKYGKVKLDTNNENITAIGSDIGEGGLPSQMIYYLTGVESQEYYNEETSELSKKEIYEILENALNSSNSVINIGIYDNVHSCKLTDGSNFSLDVGSGGHALCVTKVTKDTVTFVNPWDTSVEYTASWKEFASLGIGYVAVSDLSKAVEKEVADNTNNDYSYNYNPYSDYSYGYNYDYNPYSDYGKKYKPDFKPDFEPNFEPDYNNEDIFDDEFSYLEPDFDDSKNMPDNGSKFDNNISIFDIFNEFFNILSSLINMIKI